MVDRPVSKEQVRALLGEDFPSSRSLLPFIDTADLVIRENLAGKGLTETRLTQIELYLAAHFAYMSLNRGTLVLEKAGESEVRYSPDRNQGNAQGFLASQFGQTAVQLDSSNTLAKLGITARAEFTVINVDRRTLPWSSW